METREFILLVFRALGGEIRGKTKLQKTIYFLGILSDRLENLGYRAHFYGPYSDEVAEAVAQLKAIDVLDQNIIGGWSSRTRQGSKSADMTSASPTGRETCRGEGQEVSPTYGIGSRPPQTSLTRLVIWTTVAVDCSQDLFHARPGK